jgi:adenylate cyclase
MEIAAHHGVQLAVGDEMPRAAGQDCALLKTGKLFGPHDARVRGRSATVSIWLWEGT